MTKLKDLTGQNFGRLTVVSRVTQTGKVKGARWLCDCSCGRKKEIDSTHLLSGRVASCGCLQRELTIARFTQHSGSRTPEYEAWQGMKARCYAPSNSKYPQYGGRGIRVCERWLNSFAAFRADMGLRPSSAHSIDRIDVNGNYEPSNCRWALPQTQARNKQATAKTTLPSAIAPLIDVAEAQGIAYRTVWARRKRGEPESEWFRPVRQLHYIGGVGKTMAEWAIHFGLRPDTVRMRVHRGVPSEKWFEPLSRKRA